MPYFTRFVVRDKNLRSHPEKGREGGKAVKYEDTDLWEGLDPENSLTDRLILYEVARRRYPGTETDLNFSDTEESSENGEHDDDRVSNRNNHDDEPSPYMKSSALQERSLNLNTSYKASIDQQLLSDD